MESSSKKKFSVVIPAYNSEIDIVLCLNSVKEQTYKNFEIIVIDDESTDNTRTIVENYIKHNKDLDIKYFYQKNTGPGYARSNGIKKSEGEYIAFLDSDDIWYKDKLAEANKVFMSDPSIDITYNDEKERLFDGNLIDRKYSDLEEPIFSYLITKNNPISTSTVVCKKSLLAKINAFTTWQGGGEDWEVWVLLANENARFCHINQFLGEYRRTNDSLTTKDQYYFTLTERKIYWINKLDNSYTKTEKNILIKREYTKCYYGIARINQRNKNFKKAIQYYLLTLKRNKFYFKALIGLGLSILRINK